MCSESLQKRCPTGLSFLKLLVYPLQLFEITPRIKSRTVEGQDLAHYCPDGVCNPFLLGAYHQTTPEVCHSSGILIECELRDGGLQSGICFTVHIGTKSATVLEWLTMMRPESTASWTVSIVAI